MHIRRTGVPVAGGNLVLRHQAAGKAHAKAARPAELLNIIRCYTADGNVVCVVIRALQVFDIAAGHVTSREQLHRLKAVLQAHRHIGRGQHAGQQHHVPVTAEG